MTIIGYARVSTTDQDLSIQETALRATGCEVTGARLRAPSAVACGPHPLAIRLRSNQLAESVHALGVASVASMVMLGMQRIVIESGRLNAAMRFHIDTRSAAAADEGSRFDEQNRVDASVGFKVGPWGIDAKMTNTIGYVSTERTQTTEATNTELDLNSSVELYFKTDYLPLDRLAGPGQVDRIKVNTLNPDAEDRAAAQARGQRIGGEVAAEGARGAELDRLLQPGPAAQPAGGAASQPAATSPAGTPAPASR
jgi:hypothetical protein